MGVAGSGKTAVGIRLAARLGWPFHDGDDLHPPENRRKMAAGIALTDEDRLPWLRRIHELLVEHETAGTSAVVACSALKRSYRDLLLEGTADTRLVHLRGDAGLLAERLAARRGHYFDPALLPSQLATLEEPERGVLIEVDAGLDEVVARVAAALGLADPPPAAPTA